ncbi:alpha-L-rhamnosidase [Lacticaseibacillus zeae]|uniref:alpha-L-rhamnosidase n=1 Tax=Lacticaseibacillus zeae TaxID=57037 RepID=A0A5R8LWM0_LACZE|nr:family 78 glycoside hydrolase catalytic domain [Lacticaseibacillus zeae]TLF41741.1 alpha-L-rhamnosidase [Lacticaseibacillus zeae]
MSNITAALYAPDHLSVNLQHFAYNVQQHPRFSWWNHSSFSDASQAAYQLVIFKRLQDRDHQTYLYDSGWVHSAQNSAITAADLADSLHPGDLYYWQVRIKDNLGHTSDFSQPAKFICADPALPVQQGIWRQSQPKSGEELAHIGNVVFLRSPQLTIDTNDVDTAVVVAFARGNEPIFAQSFDLYVNGHCLGVGSARQQEHDHGTDRTAVYYNVYDATDYLENGINTIAALATSSSDRRAFWCQLIVYKHDGTKEVVTTADPSWRALDGSSAFGDFGVKIRSQYFGMVSENIDMRYYPQNWASKTFDDHDWPAAWRNPQPMIADDEVLVPYRSENTERIEVHDANKRIVTFSPQNRLIDLGKEIIGGLTVDLASDTDQRVTVLMGEQLEDNGHVRHDMACGPDYVENWTLVKGENHFTTLQMKNFRYVELLGFEGDLHLDAINGWAMQQRFPDNEGNFQSDSDLLNREYELSKYTIKATNQDVFVDSQARERRPYEGDLLVNANTSYTVSANYSLARHSLDYLIDNPTWPEDYKLFAIEMAWLDFLYTGDDTLLKTRYTALQYKLNRGKSAESFDGASQSFKGSLKNSKGVDNFDEKVGLVTNDGLVDWPISERDGFVEGTYNTPFNAIFYGAYSTMAKIAKVLHHDDDAAHYQDRAATIKKNLIDKLYDDETGRFFDSLNADQTINRHTSHHASAYALCYGVYTDQAMADRLSQFVANNGQFVGSIYFIYFMLKGLFESGHAADAITLLTDPNDQKDHKSFAAILDSLKATIAPEAWSNHYKPNLTLSHPWGATPGLTIVQGIAGIMPIEPGFSTFRIKVRAGNLTHLNLTTPSVKGLITVHYQQDAGNQTLEVAIPMNAKAQVELPAQAHQVAVQDQFGKDWTTAVQHDDQTLTIPAGSYRITYQQGTVGK